MRILVSGSTGLVGSTLVEALQEQGHQVLGLFRPSPPGQHPPFDQEQHVLWDPVADLLDSSAEEAGAVVHLAGASIAAQRWTSARKQTLEQSRVAATRQLVRALGKLRRPPQIFVAASAIGFYGNRGEEVLTEQSDAGSDFLARLSRDWESESLGAQAFGARVVILRCGIVLAKHGGALPRMAFPFRLGVGGPIGSGKQWMSWITLEDVVRIISYALATSLLSGPANAVAPHPVRNGEFATDLGLALHRPSFFPTPAFVLRFVFGEMADSLLLASQRVLPEKLKQLGYRFLHPELESALETVLGTGR